MSKSYRSDALASVHEMMESLHDIGAVTKQTMREFDELCLQPALSMSPEQIRALREREHLSQPVFARYMNVSKNLISDSEVHLSSP
ncbi:transcriptional regulator [Escherichia coli]